MNRINDIRIPDAHAAMRARERWNSIAKPLGSLGAFEDMIARTAGIQGTEKVSLDRCIVVVMCGDHGVTQCGVTQCDSSVTARCAVDIAEGRSNINVMADSIGADVIAVDAGIAADVRCDRLICRKAAYGTQNMTVGPAMTHEQCIDAVTLGMDIVKELRGKTDIIVSGEMGIGNTTAAAAMASVFLDADPASVTGRGAGLSGEGYARKVDAVRTAIRVNAPDKGDALDVLRKVGGLEIAAMTGLFLGGAVYHIPVVIDGVISAAAAAAAYGIRHETAGYMLASHCSDEPASKGMLRMMGLRPVIDAGLRLGEGTGAVMLIPMLRAALAVYHRAHTFEDIELERYKEYGS